MYSFPYLEALCSMSSFNCCFLACIQISQEAGQKGKVRWSQSVVSDWVSDPTDCSLPGSSIHGIFQARVLEWVAISYSRGSSWPRDRTQVSHIAGRRFTVWATREVTLSLLLYKTHKLGDLGHVVKSLWASASSPYDWRRWPEELTNDGRKGNPRQGYEYNKICSHL